MMDGFVAYDDLILRIEPAPGYGAGLQVRTLVAPTAHPPPVPLRPPFAEEEARETLSSLARYVWRSGHRGEQRVREVASGGANGSVEKLDPMGVGRALFDSLFAGALRDVVTSCLVAVDARGGEPGLRLRLSFSPEVAASVSAWPWELLYHSEAREFLARGLATPVVRQLEGSRAVLTPRPVETLDLLVVLSNPAGVLALDTGREREGIEAALAPLDGVALRFLERPTLDALRRELRRGADVIHFVGHGALDESGEGRLLLERSDGSAEPVSGAVLADTVGGARRARVVVLNGCNTARLPRDDSGLDAYSGLASALVMDGAPAVVAMQFPITDDAAIQFCGAFYSYLASGDPIEAAVTEARKAIYRARPTSWEWVTPVLYLRAAHGHLFRFAEARRVDRPESMPRSPDEPPRAASVADRAIGLLEGDQYEPALETLQGGLNGSSNDASLLYYAALARLRGSRPRSNRLDVIRAAEADLDLASHYANGSAPAHLWYLRALIKHDFYRFKGMRVRPPSVDEILEEARSAPTDPAELRRLLHHVTTPPSPVREAIEDHLEESARDGGLHRA